MTGSHDLTVDAKGRVFIPKAVRERLGMAYRITRGLYSGTLVLVPEGLWPEATRQWSEDVDRALYHLTAAALVKVNTSGRIMVPVYLRNWAGIAPDDHVTISDLGDSLLLTRSDRWDLRVEEAQAVIRLTRMKKATRRGRPPKPRPPVAADRFAR